MKQSEIVKAYPVVKKLYQQPLSLASAYQVYNLMKALQPFWDAQVEKEKELANEFKPVGADGNILHFDDKETAKKFSDAIHEFGDTEQEVNVEPAVIRLSEQITITASEIPALGGFVHFID